MKHLKIFEDWDANAAPLSKGEKIINSIGNLKVGDKVSVKKLKYGEDILTDIPGTIKQIRESFVNEQPRYHFNIYFDVPIGNDQQNKRDNWMFGPYNSTPENIVLSK